jgi:ketosteroid isomerase-like protein
MIHGAARLVVLALTLSIPLADDQTGAPALDFMQLERAWNEAHLKGDVPALEQLWADDLTVTVPGMAPMDKEQSLRFWREFPVRFTRYESTGVSARRLGTDGAIVTGRLSRERNFGGRVASETWQFTKVYVRQGAAWRVSAFHASESPK